MGSQGVLFEVRASEPKEGDMMSELFVALLNTPVEISMKKTGEIVEIKGTEKLVEGILAMAPDLDENSKKMMKASMENDFGGAALARSLEQMTFIYPESPVSVKDTWSTEFSGKVNAINEWTLESITDDVLAISGSAQPL